MSMIKLNGCFYSVLRVCELGEGARKLRNLFLRGMEHTRSIIHSFSCLSFDRNAEKFLRRRGPNRNPAGGSQSSSSCSVLLPAEDNIMWCTKERISWKNSRTNKKRWRNKDLNGQERDGLSMFRRMFRMFRSMFQCFTALVSTRAGQTAAQSLNYIHREHK